VCAGREAARDHARDGGDGAAELGGEVGRGERAGAVGGLDDDGDLGERGDDAVARDEAPALRGGAGRQLGDDGAARRDRRVQAPAAGRVGDVGTAREHADRGPRPAQRAGVGGGVDPHGEAGDDGHARDREAAPDAAGDVEPVRRGTARADHGDAVLRRESARVAEHVQDSRRVGEVTQPLRVRITAAADRDEPGGERRRPGRGSIEARVAPADIRARPDVQQFVVGQRQNPPGRGPALELDLKAPRNARDQRGTAEAVVAGGHDARSRWSATRHPSARRWLVASAGRVLISPPPAVGRRRGEGRPRR
jgi:hypothetical protein